MAVGEDDGEVGDQKIRREEGEDGTRCRGVLAFLVLDFLRLYFLSEF